jgi:hypothetical protein
MKSINREILYRVEAIHFQDETTLTFETYRVKRRTKCGAWVIIGLSGEKFILNEGRKRFAYDTKESAMISFKARKQAQIRILTAQLKNAEKALAKTGDKIKKPRKYTNYDIFAY